MCVIPRESTRNSIFRTEITTFSAEFSKERHTRTRGEMSKMCVIPRGREEERKGGSNRISTMSHDIFMICVRKCVRVVGEVRTSGRKRIPEEERPREGLSSIARVKMCVCACVCACVCV